MRFFSLLGRSLRLRCPRCGKDKLYSGLLRMRSSCEHCALRFEREPGFYLGAIYFNYGLTALVVAFGYPVLWLSLILDSRQAWPFAWRLPSYFRFYFIGMPEVFGLVSTSSLIHRNGTQTRSISGSKGRGDRNGIRVASLATFPDLKIEIRCQAAEDQEGHRHHKDDAPKVALDHIGMVASIRHTILAGWACVADARYANDCRRQNEDNKNRWPAQKSILHGNPNPVLVASFAGSTVAATLCGFSLVAVTSGG